MYIWVILATFVVTIYSFNLSYRSDMKDLYSEAKIEPTIAKLFSQHQAAEKYAQPTTSPSGGVQPVSYAPGELSFSDLKDFLPYGYKDHMSSGTFRSQIYCLSTTDTTASSLAPGCSTVNPSNCCSGTDSQAFLITFTCLPQKYRNAYTGRVSADVIKVISKTSSVGGDIGYVDSLSQEEISSRINEYQSSIGLRTNPFRFVSIPGYIVREKLANTSASFAEVCGELKSSSNEGCDSCIAQLTKLR